MSTPITTSQAPRSDVQLATAQRMLGELAGHDKAQADRLVDWLNDHERKGTLTKERASKLIGGLIDILIDILKAHQAVRPARPEVPEGRYAIENGEGVLRFYHVEVSDKGRYDVRVQASDELHPLPNWTIARAVLAEIEKDPKAAAIRYGLELGVCGKCGRTLTNESSRAAGIGPVCAGKF
jgi:hypothetical protein